ncbi:MAG: CRISPR system precrRNA processing endoribonuclease RAMP protein Cas6 [Sulfuritalea sp.]|nr:CRISPR system precrRNA processing endoribonuclease RAMP protein Cas6 [Sulfuritalea sp.]
MHPPNAVTASTAMLDLPIIRYRFDCVARTPIRLPDYAGSLLRGAFGRALRQVACITREKDCAPCALKRGCPYTAVFAPGKPETPHPRLQNSEIPAPYVIEPPGWGARIVAPGESFVFHMVLIGRAVEHLPIVILAWRRALARGLGPGDGTGDIAAVVTETGQVIHTPTQGSIAVHESAVACPRSGIPGTQSAPARCLLCTTFGSPAGTFAEPPATVTLRFSTPLRLQQNGNALPPHRLTPRPLILAAARRASLLAEFHGTDGTPPALDWKALAAEADALDDQRRLEWRDWTRYSSRQQRPMTLGGVVGDWTLKGSIGHAWPWLYLGQWLHLGKETVFGLGGYRLESGLPDHNSTPGGKDCGRPAQVTEGKERKG